MQAGTANPADYSQVGRDLPPIISMDFWVAEAIDWPGSFRHWEFRNPSITASSSMEDLSLLRLARAQQPIARAS